MPWSLRMTSAMPPELGELRGPRIGAVDHGARLETVGVDRANVSDRHATHPLVP